jgi:hypothetical protein
MRRCSQLVISTRFSEMEQGEDSALRTAPAGGTTSVGRRRRWLLNDFRGPETASRPTTTSGLRVAHQVFQAVSSVACAAVLSSLSPADRLKRRRASRPWDPVLVTDLVTRSALCRPAPLKAVTELVASGETVAHTCSCGRRVLTNANPHGFQWCAPGSPRPDRCPAR